MPKSTSQKQAIEILADPSSAEHQWINACTILENENFRPVKNVKAGALGWIGAVIDSTITAISSGIYLTLMYAVGCGLGMDISLKIKRNCGSSLVGSSLSDRISDIRIYKTNK